YLTVPAAQFYARHNGALISFPLMILVMFSHARPALLKILTTPPIQTIVISLGVATSLWHVQASAKWSAFLEGFRATLVSHTGIIQANVILEPSDSRSGELAKMMTWSWTNPDLSILALPRRCITSIVANSTTGWEPYNLQD